MPAWIAFGVKSSISVAGAGARRARRRVTFSRNITLSLSRTCRCYCKYCAFATHGAHLYAPEEVLGIALGTGFGGAAVAAATQRGWPLSTGVTVALCIAGAGALLTLAVTRRLPLERMERAVARTPLPGA